MWFISQIDLCFGRKCLENVCHTTFDWFLARFGFAILDHGHSDACARASTKRRSQVAGRRSQVAGRRSQVAGRRSQVAGRRSQIADNVIKKLFFSCLFLCFNLFV